MTIQGLGSGFRKGLNLEGRNLRFLQLLGKSGKFTAVSAIFLLDKH